jgi:hypothetical protein
VNKEYFALLLKSIDKVPFNKVDSNLTSYNNDLDRITVKLHGNKVTVRCESNCLKVEIDINFRRIDGQIDFPGKVPFFSLSWWRWKKLARKLEGIHILKHKIEAQQTVTKNKTEMDEAMIQIFPEIIEKTLLGGGDDK